jgi:recombination protein RecR
MALPRAIQALIEELQKLPSVGPKTAERYAFYLLRQPAEQLQKFAQAIAELKENITICQNCLAIAEKNPCHICTDEKRDKTTICVVADTRDMIAVESTKQYSGQYHILGGLINTIENIKPENLNIEKLIDRTKNKSVKEIILALSPNMEGETTSLYLTKILKNTNLKISRLAKGLPTGSDLEYADEMTLINALKYRNEL